MTIVRSNTFEGIGTAGTVIDNSNSVGGGNAFSFVDGSPLVSTVAMHGTYSADCTGIGVRCFMAWDTITSTLTWGYRFYMRRTSTPSAEQIFMAMRNSSTQVHGNNLSTANKIKVTESGGGARYTSTTTLAQDTWYRVECYGTVATASTGSWTWKLFLGDSTTALETSTLTDVNLGTTGIVMFRLGKNGASGNMGLIVDDMAFGNTASAIGPASDPADTRAPASVVSNPGAWTILGGAAAIVDSLADSDDATGIRSPDDPSAATITLEFAALTPNKPVRVVVNHASPAGSGTISRTYTLMEGASARAARTLTLPEALTSYSFTTTTAETATITDWTALRVKVVDTLVP